MTMRIVTETSNLLNVTIRLRRGREHNRPGCTPSRQNYSDGRALANLAIRFNPAAVQLGNVFHNRKPKPCPPDFAASSFVRAIKPLKNSRQILLTDSSTGIGDAEADLAIVAFRAKTDDAALIGILQGIVEQVIENLAQPLFVSLNAWAIFRYIDGRLQTL